MNYQYNTYRHLCLLIFLSFFGISKTHSQIIYTVAGNGTWGYTGDGGPATSAQISYPYSVASDAAGGFFLGNDQWWTTTTGNARVRRVNAAGIITTYAGTGTPGFSGDGGPATAAQIGGSSTTWWGGGGVASDATGNLYIYDYGNYRVRKVDASTGIITTIAGNGTAGYSGDGGPATAASIGWSGGGWWGMGIASDPYGNIYMYAWGYNKVRRIDASSGIITTYAGTGTWSFSGDGGPATAATFGYLYGIAADGYGNVFLSDWTYKRIRKINSSGIISTYGGTGTAGFGGDGGPATASGVAMYNLGISIDGAGNLYIAEYNPNNRVRRIDPSGIITTVAGTGTYNFSGDGGPATACTFRNPYNTATDGAGNVYVSDYSNVRIRKINNYNRPISFVAGLSATLTVCQNSLGDSVNTQLAVHDSDMFQYASWSVLTPASHGTASTPWGAVTTGFVFAPHLCTYKPATGYTGLDTFRVRVFDGFMYDTITIYVTVNPLPGTITGTTSFSTSGYTTLSSTPTGGTWSSGSSTIAAASGTTGVVTGVSVGVATITYTLPVTGCIRTTTVNVFQYAGQIITTVAGNGTGGYLTDGVPATSTRINYPNDVVLDGAGNFYFVDEANNRIRKVNSLGIISTIAGTGTGGFSGDGGPATAAQLLNPTALALDNSGNVYVADMNNHRVRKISTSGIITTVAGNGSPGYLADGIPATATRIHYPIGVEVDGSGNLYIADQYNHRIRMVNSSGIISTIAGTGTATYGGDGSAATLAQINMPHHICLDRSGNLYISDFNNNRIRKVNTSGIISTFAGTGVSGHSGDGGAAISAKMTNPWGVHADALGDVYITTAGVRIRKITSAGIITTIAGTGSNGYGGDACAASTAVLDFSAGVAVDGNGAVYFADRNNHRVRKIYDNHAPVFTGGHRQASSMCQNSVDTINLLLPVNDVDLNQNLTWAVATGALNGTVVASYSAASTGGSITPTGMYYTPTIGYSGTDSFKIIVTDCSGGIDTTWIVVTINPPPSSIAGLPSVCVGLTTPFSSMGTGTWSSSAPTIASVGSSSGIVTGVAAGMATITFAPGASCFVTKIISVNVSPAAVTGPTDICVGTPTTYTDATVGGLWSVTGTGAISVGSSSGVVTGTTAGTATVSYTHSGCPAMLNITVNALPGIISGGFMGVCEGSTVGLIDLTPGGTWSCSTPTIGTIDAATGILAGISVGTALVSYTMPSACFVTTTVNVQSVPSPIVGPPIICVGQAVYMTDPSPGGVWSISSIGMTGSCDSLSGRVEGLFAGTATVSYTYLALPNCSVSMTLTIDPTPSAISGASTVCIGQSTLLTNPTTGGIWTSSNISRATVGSSSGIVTGGTSSGAVTITYTLPSGCYVTHSMVVNSGPATITGTLSVCNGLTTLLSSSTTGGAWSSATPAVAMVGSSSGVVFGSSPGTAVISYTVSGCVTTAVVTVNSSPGAITGTLNACPSGTRTLSAAVGGGTWRSGTTSIATIGSTSGIVTATSTPGTTIITYSIGSGCSSTAVFTVNPLPGAIVGTMTVCQGATTTLSNPTSPGGTWTASGGVTVGSSSGIVTGSTPGMGVVTYTLPTGCARNAAITVNMLPAVITGPGTVCQGQNVTLSSASTGGIWSSSNPSVAIIGSTSGVLTASATATGPVTITYALGTGCSQTKTITVNALPPNIVGPGSVCELANITLTNPSGGGTWNTASSTASVGSSSGIVSGISGGTALISYTLSTTGCSATKTVTVNSLPVIVGPSALCASATITQSSTPGGVWTSGTPSVATIGSSSGIVNGVVTGSTVITYVLPTGCSSTKGVTVSSSPGSIGGANTVCVGLSTTLTNSTIGGWWISSSGAASVGSLSGTVTGVAPGTATITYSLGSGCTQTHTMTVTPSPAAIIGTPNLCLGTSTSLTDPTPGGTWSSSATGVASITSGGLMNGAGVGTATISYTVGSCAAILPVTVNTAPASIGGPTQVCIGATINVTNSVAGGVWSTASPVISIGSSTGAVTGLSGGSATITYAIGSCMVTRVVTVNGVTPITGPTGVCVGRNITLSSTGGGTWTSGATGVATIGSSSGIVNGVASGSAIITYTLGTGCSTTTTVNVNTAPGTITGTLRVCGGQQTTLSNTVSGGVWSSSSSVATVGSLSGIVTGGSATGTATITYSLGSGCTVTAVVTVNASPAAISGASQICMSSTATMSNPTPGGVWTSIGSPITTGGVLTGATVGVTTVSYTLTSGCAATKDVTVNAAAPSIIGSPNICVGLTTGLSNAAMGGTWSSSSISIATVGSSGTVTGVSPGVSTITYTLGTGCIATQPVTVNGAPGAITGSPQLCIGSTTVLSNGTPGGTWTSGHPAIATVSSGGVVSGAALGTADISYSVGGCPAVLTITVNPLPSAITGPDKVCVGDNITLGNPATGGTWSSSNPVVAAIDPATGVVSGGFAGTANITYSMGVGCTVNKIITVNPLPSSISGSANICLGSTTMLTSASPGGVWSSGSTSIATIGTTGRVSGVGSGTAMISYTLPTTGCAATFGVIVVSVAPIDGITSDLCAWGDTMLIHNTDTAGTFSSTLLTVANIGGGYGIVTGYAAGTATITYTLTGLGCMAISTITVNPLPAQISGSDRVCLGQTSMLSNATPGGTWSSSVPSVAPISTGGLVSSLAVGTTTIAYTLPTGCKTDTVFIVNAMPSPIIGIGQVCAGATTTYMDTTIGGWWTSAHPSIASVGVGTGLVTGMGAGVTTITYSLASSCRVTRTVTVNPLPTQYIVTGGGNYCDGGTGMHVGLAGSQNTVNYQLYNGASTVGAPVPGTGIAIDFGLQTAIGTYSVIGTNPLTTCTKNMSGSTVIGTIPTVIPSVSVSSSAGNPVCIGTPSTFTAAPVNGGSAPSYQWFVNSVPVTGTGASYSYTPANGDIIKAELTSSATCATPPVVNGDLTMNVLNMFVPTVTITGQPGLTITSGQWDTLTANVVNGSSSQSYQWYWNGWPVSGVYGNTYINKNFANGDSVRCVVTSTGMCGGFTGQASVTLTVLPGSGVGVSTITGNGLVQVVPNPNKGTFSIKGTLSGVTDEEVSIEITNMLGQVIYRQNAIARNGKLDEQVKLGQTVASGMYLLNLKSGSDTKVFHIVVEQ